MEIIELFDMQRALDKFIEETQNINKDVFNEKGLALLVDVFGEGVLITGESGIGKSEAALELVKRGHRLVSDDVVEIRKVSDDTLYGSSSLFTNIRYIIEYRMYLRI